MEEVKRIYILLLRNNGLKIKDVAQKLDLDKYHVADILFSTDNIPFWYQDSSSLWFAKEGAIVIEEPEETKEPLITSIEIPQRFNISKFLEEDLSDSLRAYLHQISKYRIYSNDEMIELFKRYRNGDKNAFDLIIMSQQRLVANMALLYCRKGTPLEDIIQEGNVGLVKAAERFDYTQYRSFSNYAKSWILQSISFAMASMPYMIRLPLNQLSLYRKVRDFKDHYEQENGYSPSINDIDLNESSDLDRIKYLDGLPYNLKSLMHLSDNMDVFESRTNAIEDLIDKNEVQFSVKKLLRRLQKRERQMLQMFYGINRKEESLASIGDFFGLTRERARQIKEKTVRHLRDILNSRKENVDKMKINIQDDEDDDLDIGSTLAMSQSNNKEKDEPKKRQGVVIQIDDLKEGDEIYYNDVLCTVKTIIESAQSPKLIIEYQNGVRDVVLYNKSKYSKVAHSPKTNREYVQPPKERHQFQLSTPLSKLVDLNIITEKQLYQCRKKGLKNIGDVKHIIEKYELTLDSTRFTKYTLDMWFTIISLLNKSHK
jgi:RNA polymerase primary sigma factor